MPWQIPKIWTGSDVWIIGGGASIVEQFEIPESVVDRVIAGEEPLSTYSPYMKAIHDRHVIGVNVAFLIGTWMDMMFFGDNGFLLKFQYDLAKFPKPRISCNSLTRKYLWIKTLDKQRGKPFGISDRNREVCWNSNSGGAVISLAAHLGAKRIFLLGYDMKLNGEGRQHWHGEYLRRKTKEEDMHQLKKTKRLPFHIHLKGFHAIAKDAERMGIEIVNVSPHSEITQFPKVTLKEALKWGEV